MQQNYAKIQAAGADLIAISSDSERDTRNTVQNHGLKFPVLADQAKAAITDYNVVDPGNSRIARPAAYIVKKDGTIVWKSLNGIAVRVPTADILTELGKL